MKIFVSDLEIPIVINSLILMTKKEKGRKAHIMTVKIEMKNVHLQEKI